MWRRLAYLIGHSLRESGQALDRAGSRLQGDYAFVEQLSRHRRLMALYDKRPQLQNDVFVAPNASVIGQVSIGPKSTVWYGSVLRGDVNSITIGSNSSIGDNVIIHVSSEQQPTGASPAVVGNNVVVESGAILHACQLEDECKIGTGSVIFDGAVVGKNSEIAPGSLVPSGKHIPSGQLWAGSPARYVRDLTEDERERTRSSAGEYYLLGRKHSAEHQLTEQEREDQRMKSQQRL